MPSIKRIRRAVRQEIKRNDEKLHKEAADAFRRFIRELPWHKRVWLGVAVLFRFY